MSKKNTTQELLPSTPDSTPDSTQEKVESWRDGIPCTETLGTDKNGKPVTLISMRVDDICRIKRGVHCVVVFDFDANAILRQAKTACAIDDAECRVQVGDFIHFEVRHQGLNLRNISHPLNKAVYEATYVSTCGKDSNGKSLVCFKPIDKYTFIEGKSGFSNAFPVDTITYLEPRDPS